MRHKPAYKQTCEETTQWKKYLSGNKIENIKQRLSEKRKTLHATKRQRTESAHQTTTHGNNKSRHVTGDM